MKALAAALVLIVLPAVAEPLKRTDCPSLSTPEAMKYCEDLNRISDGVEGVEKKIAAIDKLIKARNAVTLKMASYSGLFADRQILLDLSIKNTNEFPVKDISIVCQQLGKSGTAIKDYRQVVYERISARGSTLVKGLFFGWNDPQTASLTCHVDNLVVLQ